MMIALQGRCQLKTCTCWKMLTETSADERSEKSSVDFMLLSQEIGRDLVRFVVQGCGQSRVSLRSD